MIGPWDGKAVTNSFMLEVGVIMLVAFTGAALASRLKQSVILGYTPPASSSALSCTSRPAG